MKIEILMLKENNERGVRMMFLSLEQLQKLKLNPTRADYEIAYETEVKEQEGTAELLPVKRTEKKYKIFPASS